MALLTISILLFLFIIGVLIIGRSMIAGYGAKVLCSCVFVSGRSSESVLSEELSIYPFIWAEVDTARRVAYGSTLGMSKRIAVYRGNALGCQLVPPGEQEAHEKNVDAISAEATSSFSGSRNDVTVADSILGWGNSTDEWKEQAKARGLSVASLERGLEAAFSPTAEGRAKGTRAVVIVYDSAIVAERYAPGFPPSRPQMGWSMTKSVTHALTGILHRQDRINPQAPAPISLWQNPDDPRKDITINQLLQMRSGLRFQEMYFLPSHALRMLFVKQHAGEYAASLSLSHPAGTQWKYSSGTTNIISKLLRESIPRQEYNDFPWKELFHKIGMNSAVMEQDPGGTFVGSSFMWATPRDWAKFGLLYLWDGVWMGERILPNGWVNYARTPSPALAEGYYGAHFWLNAGKDVRGTGRKWANLPKELYWASGFEGQYIFIFPAHKLVVVRLGFTPLRFRFNEEAFLTHILAALPD